MGWDEMGWVVNGYDGMALGARDVRGKNSKSVCS